MKFLMRIVLYIIAKVIQSEQANYTSKNKESSDSLLLCLIVSEGLHI